MPILSDYTAGTVTVAAGGTAVTGVGTAWQTAGFQEGDEFFAAGWHGIVQSVNSNTSITLYPTGIRGAALAGSAYRLRYQGDGSRLTAQARQLIEMLGAGNISALAGLVGAADKLPYFTGAGTMALTGLMSVARSFLSGNFMPIQQGGGAGQGSNKIYIGWDGVSALKAQLDSSDLGRVWTDFSAPATKATPGVQRLPNGIILQWWRATVSNGDAQMIYPVALAGAPYFLAGHVLDTPYSANTSYSLSFDTITATTFNARGRFNSGGTTGVANVFANFFAIGAVP